MCSALFSPLELRGLTLNNRIAVSSMCQYAAENGSAVDWHMMHLGQFAMGAAGLVMTEATAVSEVGRITPKCLGLYSDENEATLKRAIDFCREYGVISSMSARVPWIRARRYPWDPVIKSRSPLESAPKPR